MRIFTPPEVYRRAQFREFHNEQGHLTFDDFETRLMKIGDLPLFDIETNSMRTVRSCFGVKNNIER